MEVALQSGRYRQFRDSVLFAPLVVEFDRRHAVGFAPVGRVRRELLLPVNRKNCLQAGKMGRRTGKTLGHCRWQDVRFKRIGHRLLEFVLLEPAR